MNSIVSNILTLIFLPSFFVPLSADLEQKIRKQIIKLYQINEFEIEEFTLEDSLQQQVENGIFQAIYSNHNLQGIVYMGKVKTCAIGGCVATNQFDAAPDLDSEYFDYIIYFDTTASIKKIRILDYNATYGYEVCSKNWLKQFIGYFGKESLLVGKNVDGISGATISANAIAMDITMQTKLVKSILTTVEASK